VQPDIMAWIGIMPSVVSVWMPIQGELTRTGAAREADAAHARTRRCPGAITMFSRLCSRFTGKVTGSVEQGELAVAAIGRHSVRISRGSQTRYAMPAMRANVMFHSHLDVMTVGPCSNRAPRHRAVASTTASGSAVGGAAHPAHRPQISALFSPSPSPPPPLTLDTPLRGHPNYTL